ncbi:MAG: DUF4492 domain-containing protein [Paramuribaculum sp.]|nr:DUF4492 domain-containing protein [Paramuribaculum sp.]
MNGSMINKIANFYIEGFRNMTIGRSLWVIIILKIVILFGVLKLFFFPNILKRDYNNDAERADAVRVSLMKHDNKSTNYNN